MAPGLTCFPRRDIAHRAPSCDFQKLIPQGVHPGKVTSHEWLKQSCPLRETPVGTWPSTANQQQQTLLTTAATQPSSGWGVHCPATQGTGVLRTCTIQGWTMRLGHPIQVFLMLFRPWTGDRSKWPSYWMQFWCTWRVSWECQAPLAGETCLPWGCKELAQLCYGPGSQSTALLQDCDNQNSWFLGNQINSTEISAASKSLSAVPSEKYRLFSEVL